MNALVNQITLTNVMPYNQKMPDSNRKDRKYVNKTNIIKYNHIKTND